MLLYIRSIVVTNKYTTFYKYRKTTTKYKKSIKSTPAKMKHFKIYTNKKLRNVLINKIINDKITITS